MQENKSEIRFRHAGDKLAGILQLARHSPLTLVYGTGSDSVLPAPATTPRAYEEILRTLATPMDEREHVIVIDDWQDAPLATLLRKVSLSLARLSASAVPDDTPLSLKDLLERGEAKSGARYFFIFDRFDTYLARPFSEPRVREFDLAFGEIAGTPRLEASFLIIMDDSESGELCRYAHRFEEIGNDYLRMPDFSNMPAGASLTAAASVICAPAAQASAGMETAIPTSVVPDSADIFHLPLAPSAPVPEIFAAAPLETNSGSTLPADLVTQDRLEPSSTELLRLPETPPVSAGGAKNSAEAVSDHASATPSVRVHRDFSSIVVTLAGETDELAASPAAQKNQALLPSGSAPIIVPGGLHGATPVITAGDDDTAMPVPAHQTRLPAQVQKNRRRTGINIVLGVMVVSMLAAAPYFYAGKPGDAVVTEGKPAPATPRLLAGASLAGAPAAANIPAKSAGSTSATDQTASAAAATTAAPALVVASSAPARPATAATRTMAPAASRSQPAAAAIAPAAAQGAVTAAANPVAALLPQASADSLAREQKALREPSGQRVTIAPLPASTQTPNTLLIRVGSPAQRARVEAAAATLATHGLTFGEIGNLRRGSNASELRYFHASDKAPAMRTYKVLREAGVPVRRVYRVWDSADIKPGQYELWLGNPRAAGTAPEASAAAPVPSAASATAVSAAPAPAMAANGFKVPDHLEAAN